MTQNKSDHDYKTCYIPHCQICIDNIKKTADTYDDTKPQSVGVETSQQDELKEAVKRFCRTDEAANNLVNYISAHYTKNENVEMSGDMDLDKDLLRIVEHKTLDDHAAVELIKNIIESVCMELISSVSINQKGLFDDIGGNACWYLDDLEKSLRQTLQTILGKGE